VLAGRCGCLRWVDLGFLSLAGAIKMPVFFWKLAQMDILTIRDQVPEWRWIK